MVNLGFDCVRCVLMYLRRFTFLVHKRDAIVRLGKSLHCRHSRPVRLRHESLLTTRGALRTPVAQRSVARPVVHVL